ncbi:MAG: hypothetical protein ACFB6R_11445 [Alphaproteobacteria bacterium]
MARTPRRITEQATRLKDLLDRIEEAGYFSVEGVISGAMIDAMYNELWHDKPAEKRPSRDFVAARVWLATRRLQQRGFGDVESVPDLSPRSVSKERRYEKFQQIPLEALSAFSEDDLPFNLELTIDEIEFIIGYLEKRGFDATGLPITDIHKEGRANAKAAAADYSTKASDWTIDPVFDLVHYAMTTRHAAMNREWRGTAPHMIYTAWFVQLNQPDHRVNELYLYRGKFVIKAEKTNTGNTLLRTSHIQYAFSAGDLPVRHDGLMFETGDKHVVMGFSRDSQGNHTPQTMQLDGRNRSARYGGVFDVLAGWQATTDQFEDVRRDGLMGTGIYMKLDTDMTNTAHGTTSLSDLLDALTDETENYCKLIVRADMTRRDSPVLVSTTRMDGSEREMPASDSALTAEERQAVSMLKDYSDWNMDDIATLIPRA